MSDVASYLAKHKADIKKTSVSGPKGQDSDSSLLTVVILSATETDILVGHLGRKFLIQQDEILQISDAPENTPNLFGYGRAAQIVIKKTATLVYEQTVSVAELEFGQPFAMARPPAVPHFTSELYSPNEIAWRQANRVPAVNFTPFVTASETWSKTATATNCQYASDDSGFDDSQGDGQFLDD